MDTTILRFALAAVALLAAAYLIWPQVAIWLDRVKQPVCGKCRYPAAGIAILRCPECGGDLREVGILTPAMMMRRAPGPGTRLAAWTLGWSLVGLAAAVAVAALVPARSLAIRTSPVQLRADAGLNVDVVQRVEGWSLASAPRTYELKLSHMAKPAAAGVLAFSGPDRIIRRVSGSAATEPSPVGRAADAGTLGAWLGNVGVTPAELAAAELLQIVDGIAAQPVNMATDVASSSIWVYNGSSIGVRQMTPWWLQVGLGGVWLAVWLSGLLLLARRGARGREAAGAAGSAPATVTASS